MALDAHTIVDHVSTTREDSVLVRNIRKISLGVIATAAIVGVSAGSAIAATSHHDAAPAGAQVANASGSGLGSGTGLSTTPGKLPATSAPARPVAGKPVPVHPAVPVRRPAAKPVPTMRQLMPRGTASGQQHFTPSAEQMRNAVAIVTTGESMGLPPRAYVMAVACSLQESALHNLGNLGANNDHDSLGLFQQRPSSGWGTPRQIHDPHYAAKQFYKGLVDVSNWQRLPLTAAVQKVQVSAYPNAYAKWEKQAADLVLASYHAAR